MWWPNCVKCKDPAAMAIVSNYALRRFTDSFSIKRLLLIVAM